MSTTIHVGNALDVLAGLPSESVHCCVTSPPYWGLRSYEGGEGMIGLEPTFDGHLENLVAVFREVRRVLRSDGTLWLNYGDAYTSGGRSTYRSGVSDNKGHQVQDDMPRPPTPNGLKPKDLMMMPARVAMALQADGWWLRSEIIWHKPNPMPESCTDRPTNAHEKLFMLTKEPRYFYDADAVRVPTLPTQRLSMNAVGSDTGIKKSGTDEFNNRNTWKQTRTCEEQAAIGANLRNVWTHEAQYQQPYDGKDGKDFADTGAQDARSVKSRIVEGVRSGRISAPNLKNVWKIPTHSFKEAHFATFPPKLVEPCIKAGTSERGVCGECGAPWTRQVDTVKGGPVRTRNRREVGREETAAGFPQEIRHTTTGWAPTCCDCHVPIMTPVPDGDVRPDPTMQTGRKGLNRERNTNATRAMTRGEQRDYARQIRESENREQIRDLAGDGFDHYVRTDQSGARPLPPDVLAQCIERGWLKPASAQCDCACKDAGDPVPATVLDPFGGSGTVGLVADRLQRDSVLIELSPEYAEMAGRRVKSDAPLLANVVAGGDTL